jgi:hypothetical protein
MLKPARYSISLRLREYHEFRVVAIIMDLLAVAGGLLCAGSFFWAANGGKHGWVIAVTGLLLMARSFNGMNEKFSILREIALEVRDLVGADEADRVFRHDLRKINSRVRLAFDIAFFVVTGGLALATIAWPWVF